MNKTLAHLLCCFIPSKEKRRAFRNKHLARLVIDPWQKLRQFNHIEIENEDKKFIDLHLTGENNTIIFKKLSRNFKGKIRISMAASNSTILFEEGCYVASMLRMIVGQIHPNLGPIENVQIRIGKNTAFESTTITTFNSNVTIDIGEKCMFSYGINIFHTDAHPIYDINTNQIINKVKNLIIGNHCWIGANVTILKNVIIPNDCIVGWGGVVNASINSKIEENCICSGNPASIVKTGITWNSNGSNGYIQNIT